MLNTRRQRQAIARIVVMTASWSCLASTASRAHPFHITTAEAQFKQQAQTLEVSIELNPTELERAIALRFNLDIDLDQGDAETAIAHYAEQVFVVSQAGKTAEFRWVGMELDIATGWLYFELHGIETFTNLTVENRFLVEVAQANDNQQLNTVRFSHPSASSAKLEKTTLTFTAPDYRHQLDRLQNSNPK